MYLHHHLNLNLRIGLAYRRGKWGICFAEYERLGPRAHLYVYPLPTLALHLSWDVLEPGEQVRVQVYDQFSHKVTDMPIPIDGQAFKNMNDGVMYYTEEASGQPVECLVTSMRWVSEASGMLVYVYDPSAQRTYDDSHQDTEALQGWTSWGEYMDYVNIHRSN